MPPHQDISASTPLAPDLKHQGHPLSTSSVPVSLQTNILQAGCSNNLTLVPIIYKTHSSPQTTQAQRPQQLTETEVTTQNRSRVTPKIHRATARSISETQNLTVVIWPTGKATVCTNWRKRGVCTYERIHSPT